MGLDITAYRGLKPAPGVDYEEGENWRRYARFGASMEWSESVWPGRGAPWEPDVTYSFTERFDFRAGSYSGYGAWRRVLGAFAVHVADAQAFQELTDFADNEGVIGQVASAKLLADFDRNERRLAGFEPFTGDQGDSDWWRVQYANWRKAFALAADGGAVEFH